MDEIQTKPDTPLAPNPLFAPVKPDPIKTDEPVIEKHVITDEDRDHHVKSVRDLVQQLHNRNDQDTNRVLDNVTKHLDALDGNPEQRKAEAIEAEQNRKAAEKRKAKAEEAEGEKAA